MDGLRLNLGSGPRAVPGWINIDRSPNVLLSRAPWIKDILLKCNVLNEGHSHQWDSAIVRGDIRSLPYPAGTVAAVYTSHALEHVYLGDAERVIADSFRVLQPGGLIRIALPNAAELAEKLLEAERTADGALALAVNEMLLAHPTHRPTFRSRILGLAGGHIHYWQPTPALVTRMLESAGFVNVTSHRFRSGSLPELDVIETREQSFFLEASKPSE